MPTKFIVFKLFAILIFGCQAVHCGAAEAVPPDMVTWYRQQAIDWLQAMTLGNGVLGDMVFGGVTQERNALNDCSFWFWRPLDFDDTYAFQYFPLFRDVVFAV